MRQVLSDLCGLLTEQKSVLETMLELSWEERGIIISSDAVSLEDVVRRQFRELSKLNSIEKKRLAMHDDLAEEFGLLPDDVTVSAIADKAKPYERDEIVRLQTELTKLIGEHTELNMENRELIKAHIEYSDAMLNLIVDSEDPLNNFYGGDGRATEDKKKNTGFFDGHA